MRKCKIKLWKVEILTKIAQKRRKFFYNVEAPH